MKPRELRLKNKILIISFGFETPEYIKPKEYASTACVIIRYCMWTPIVQLEMFHFTQRGDKITIS